MSHSNELVTMALEACKEYRATIDKLVYENLKLQREVEQLKKVLDKPQVIPQERGSSMRS